MKLAIITDIHGNLQALQAVLREIDAIGVDRTMCLGDIVGYYPSPNECVDLVRDRADISLQGNHDLYIAQGKVTKTVGSVAVHTLRWTMKRVTKENRDYLAGLTKEYEDEEIYAVHAFSPLWQKDDDNLRWMIYVKDGGLDADAYMSEFKQKVAFVGHAHRPMIVEREGNYLPYKLTYHKVASPEVTLSLTGQTKFAKYVVIVGSVGQPRGRDDRACFAVYDYDTHELEMRRIPYDFSSVILAVADMNVPRATKDSLIRRLQEM